ncbi:basic proline-rich protein-like [Ammospiza nelsoni]|uniref:basic proline-rich protein-like n=1 Tax=Ammospiza nelsoni TaxID=2857394 RepID=UPI00286984EC|nr:basic proline-rich protein-like [Ammospiza nelsoni]
MTLMDVTAGRGALRVSPPVFPKSRRLPRGRSGPPQNSPAGSAGPQVRRRPLLPSEPCGRSGSGNGERGGPSARPGPSRGALRPRLLSLRAGPGRHSASPARAGRGGAGRGRAGPRPLPASGSRVPGPRPPPFPSLTARLGPARPGRSRTRRRFRRTPRPARPRCARPLAGRALRAHRDGHVTASGGAGARGARPAPPPGPGLSHRDRPHPPGPATPLRDRHRPPGQATPLQDWDHPTGTGPTPLGQAPPLRDRDSPTRTGPTPRDQDHPTGTGNIPAGTSCRKHLTGTGPATRPRLRCCRPPFRRPGSVFPPVPLLLPGVGQSGPRLSPVPPRAPGSGAETSRAQGRLFIQRGAAAGQAPPILAGAGVQQDGSVPLPPWPPRAPLSSRSRAAARGRGHRRLERDSSRSSLCDERWEQAWPHRERLPLQVTQRDLELYPGMEPQLCRPVSPSSHALHSEERGSLPVSPEDVGGKQRLSEDEDDQRHSQQSSGITENRQQIPVQGDDGLSPELRQDGKFWMQVDTAVSSVC